MIRRLADTERDRALAIINDAAQAYRGVIPADCWHDPYMDRTYLDAEIAAGVRFFASTSDAAQCTATASPPLQPDELLAVMGVQDVADVTLVRHAYTRTSAQHGGIGSALIAHIRTLTSQPMLVGTWAAATWAIRFYERNGFSLVSPAEKNRLLETYWDIPARQIGTSVVLADERAQREIVRKT